jgi:hypothetical protein
LNEIEKEHAGEREECHDAPFRRRDCRTLRGGHPLESHAEGCKEPLAGDFTGEEFGDFQCLGESSGPGGRSQARQLVECLATWLVEREN